MFWADPGGAINVYHSWHSMSLSLSHTVISTPTVKESNTTADCRNASFWFNSLIHADVSLGWRGKEKSMVFLISLPSLTSMNFRYTAWLSESVSEVSCLLSSLCQSWAVVSLYCFSGSCCVLETEQTCFNSHSCTPIYSAFSALWLEHAIPGCFRQQLYCFLIAQSCFLFEAAEIST